MLDRLGKDESLEALNGSPDLLSYVMDQMAADASLATAQADAAGVHRGPGLAAGASGRVRGALL